MRFRNYIVKSITPVMSDGALNIGVKLTAVFLGVSLLISTTAIIVYPAPFASAAILRQLPFSASLKTPEGAVVDDGNYSITFSLYTAETGGTAVWSETQTISVTDGIVFANLGSSTSFPTSLVFNDSDYYLGVKVGSDAEMSPRRKIGAVPTAFNADTVDGHHAGTGADEVLVLDSSGNINFSGAVTSGTWQGTAIGSTYGGTGITSYTAGDLLYASGANTLGKLGIGGDGQVLTVSSGTLSWQTFSASGDITAVNTGSGLSGGGASGDVTLSLDTSNANTWSALQTINVTGSTALALTGTPATSATSSLLRLGSAIAGGSASGTFIGINPSSFSGNFIDFQVNGSSRASITSAGNLTLAGSAGVNSLSVTNGATVGGTLGVTGLTTLGDAQVDGNTTIGSDSNDTVTVNATLSSNIIPTANGTYDLGSATFRFRNFYADQAIFNQTTIDNTTAASFVINADNATADAEDSTLEFYRGSTTPHAIIRWDSTNDRFDFNQNVLLQGTLTAGNAATDSTTIRGQLTLQDSDASHVLLFGSDTNLYRSGTNTLTTDDSFAVGGTLAVTSTINGATISGGTLSGGTLSGSSLSTAALQGGGSFTITGGASASETLTLVSTSDSTKGNIQFFSSLNTISSSGVLQVAGQIRTAASSNQIVVNTGGILGTLTWTPTTSNKTITLPDETGTICTTGSICSGYASASGSFIAKNTNDTSTASYLGTLLGLTNSNTGAAGVLSLSNAGTNSALSVTQSSNPSSGQALIFANNTNASPSGNLIDLQGNNSSKFSVSAAGAITAASTINGLSISGGVISSPTISGTVTGSSSPTITGFGTINGATLSGGTLSGGTYSATAATGSGAYSIVAQGGNVALQASTGVVVLNQSGVDNIIRIYGDDGTDYAQLTHDGSNAILSTNSGEVQLQGTGTNQFILGDVGTAVNLVFEESATISGQGANTITVGQSGDTFNLNTSGVTYNVGTLASTGATINTSSTSTTALTINGPSSMSANLLDLQVNGSSKFSVNASGAITSAGLNSSEAVTISKSSANALALTGTPATSASASLFQLGSAISGGSANGTYIGANPSSFSGNYFDLQVNGTSRFKLDSNGNMTLTQAVITTGSPTALTLSGGAHTTLTASTEATDINFNLARTVQFATGALTTQRAIQVKAPTYAFVGSSTVSDAATLYIDRAPQAGTNATITSAWALWVDAGAVRFDGPIVAGATTLTIADNGGGTAASDTLTPTSSYVEVTCNDTNGCTLAISETGAKQGQQIDVVNVSSNTLTIDDTAGQQETSNPALGQYDTITLRYLSDRWVQYATSNN